jgi:hypothetical protein
MSDSPYTTTMGHGNDPTAHGDHDRVKIARLKAGVQRRPSRFSPAPSKHIPTRKGQERRRLHGRGARLADAVRAAGNTFGRLKRHEPGRAVVSARGVPGSREALRTLDVSLKKMAREAQGIQVNHARHGSGIVRVNQDVARRAEQQRRRGQACPLFGRGWGHALAGLRRHRRAARVPQRVLRMLL